METQQTQLRQILRIVGGFTVLYIAVMVVNLVLGVIPNQIMKWLQVSENVRAYLGSTFSYGLRLAAYVLLPALALQRALQLNTLPVFFPAFQKNWKDILFGFLLISGLLSAFFLIETRLGWLTLDGWSWQKMSGEDWLRVAWVSILVNICIAVGEETLFRGYLLTRLKTVLSRGWAVFFMMTTFGLFHLVAYIENGLQSQTLALAILLASLFGGLFGLIYLHTRSLWFPVALHFTWNFVENDVLNVTGETSNPNLIGALTRMQAPLTTTQLSWGNIVLLESLIFACIALGVMLWLRRSSPVWRQNENG